MDSSESGSSAVEEMRSTKIAVALDLAAHVLGLDVEAREDLLDDVLALAEDAEQEVLGLDDLGAELGGLVAGEEERAARLLVVLLKHGWRAQAPSGWKSLRPWGGISGFILAPANPWTEKFLPATS